MLYFISGLLNLAASLLCLWLALGPLNNILWMLPALAFWVVGFLCAVKARKG